MTLIPVRVVHIKYGGQWTSYAIHLLYMLLSFSLSVAISCRQFRYLAALGCLSGNHTQWKCSCELTPTTSMCFLGTLLKPAKCNRGFCSDCRIAYMEMSLVRLWYNPAECSTVQQRMGFELTANCNNFDPVAHFTVFGRDMFRRCYLKGHLILGTI